MYLNNIVSKITALDKFKLYNILDLSTYKRNPDSVIYLFKKMKFKTYLIIFNILAIICCHLLLYFMILQHFYIYSFIVIMGCIYIWYCIFVKGKYIPFPAKTRKRLLLESAIQTEKCILHTGNVSFTDSEIIFNNDTVNLKNLEWFGIGSFQFFKFENIIYICHFNLEEVKEIVDFLGEKKLVIKDMDNVDIVDLLNTNDLFVKIDKASTRNFKKKVYIQIFITCIVYAAITPIAFKNLSLSDSGGVNLLESEERIESLLSSAGLGDLENHIIFEIFEHDQPYLLKCTAIYNDVKYNYELMTIEPSEIESHLLINIKKDGVIMFNFLVDDEMRANSIVDIKDIKEINNGLSVFATASKNILRLKTKVADTLQIYEGSVGYYGENIKDVIKVELKYYLVNLSVK